MRAAVAAACHVHYPSVPKPGIWSGVPAPATDAEGQFRLESLTPGAAFTLILTGKNGEALSAEAPKELMIKAGESKDLGNIRVKVAAKK